MNKLSSLSILVQVYNNQNTIAEVLRDALMAGNKYSNKFEIIAVDDGSEDNSSDIIEQWAKAHPQIHIVKHLYNQGFGRTIKESYFLAKYTYVFSIPGDRQIRADVISSLMTKINDADLVVGYRKKRKDSVYRRLQSLIYNFLVRSIFKLPINDVNSSKLFVRKILYCMKLHCNSAFVDVELCLGAMKNGYRIGEAEITHYRRENGRGGGSSFRTVLPVIKELILNALEFASSIYPSRLIPRLRSGSSKKGRYKISGLSK